MKVKDFLSRFAEHPQVVYLEGQLAAPDLRKVHLKGLKGSLDTILLAALYSRKPKTTLLVAHDEEEAAYLVNDLQQLLGEGKVLYFPATFKSAYQFESVDNANVLQRAETLSVLQADWKQAYIIVTYGKGLAEKVINPISLQKNTFPIKQGDRIGMEMLIDLLAEYDFERSDFVYEAGQFAVRGGIVDVYSYSADLPYRLEFFGDEVESIRTFHPETQLSIDTKGQVSIIPDIQHRLNGEDRVPLTEFLPAHTPIWVQDWETAVEDIDFIYEKAEKAFHEQVGQTDIVLIKRPELLYESAKTFKEHIKDLPLIEIGKKSRLKAQLTLDWEAGTQPSIHKDFDLLASQINSQSQKGWLPIISSDNPKQLERLQTIFLEMKGDVQFEPLYIALRGGFEDPFTETALWTDHQIFDRYFRYKAKEKFTKARSMTLRELRTLQAGDFVTHMDYGVGRFAGLQQVEVEGKMQEAIRLIFRDDDVLTVSVHSLHKISKYSGQEGITPTLSKLGSGEWEAKKSRVKKKVRDIATELIALYAKRRLSPGFAFGRDNFMQIELESSFLYEDTPDQAKATTDVKADMEKPYPMDRLVCGDVGFGKTEVAIRAAFKAASDSKQVAVLVPTTILAKQHYKNFRDRLAKFPVKIDYLSRARSTKEVKQILADIKEGKIDILIGTHRLVSKDVDFKNLGLMVVDEEQKFGVKVKDRLKEMRLNVDCLTLTATPIPRTLQFSLMGSRDLSVINTPPPNRQPVDTQLRMYTEETIRDAIRAELKRGGQVFFIHNLIDELPAMAGTIQRLVPECKIGIIHGQIEDTAKENVMDRFENGDYDVLLSTSIVESGIDIPNANTIIINRAHLFGLSDLHQMRGRVGRSNRKAYCILLAPARHLLPEQARKRLKTLEEFSDLGDGFKVAMRDLDIRGAGELLGAEQSGFVNDLGFEAYHKILDEAVAEIKETEFRDMFQAELDAKALQLDCTVETDLEIIIPDNYVTSISERLRLYSQLDNIKEEGMLQAFEQEIADRFGPLPKSVIDLINTVRLRWLAEQAGIERLQLKNGTFKGSFLSAKQGAKWQSDVFAKIIQWIQKNANLAKLTDAKGKLTLTIQHVRNIDTALLILSEIHQLPKATDTAVAAQA